MKGHCKGKRILAAVLSALLFLPAVGCDREEAIVQDKLTFTTSMPVKYGNEAKTEQADRLHQLVYEALLKKTNPSVANVWKENHQAKRMLVRLGTSLEGRSVPFAEYERIVNTLCEKEELLLALFDGEKRASERFAVLFGELAKRIGVGRTALVGYDFILSYCQYQFDSFEDRYRAHPDLTYLRKESVRWAERKAELAKIGERNFSSLLRFWLSGLTVFTAQMVKEDAENPSVSPILSAMYPGEGALFLRTQGEVVGGLQITEESYAFLITFFGEVFGVRVCEALVAANKQAEYAKHAQGVMHGLSLALSSAEETQAELFLQGDIYGGCKLLFSALSKEEKQPFTDALAVENAPEAYTAYIHKLGLTEKWKEYVGKTRGELEEKIYASSPQLAFLVFER